VEIITSGPPREEVPPSHLSSRLGGPEHPVRDRIPSADRPPTYADLKQGFADELRDPVGRTQVATTNDSRLTAEFFVRAMREMSAPAAQESTVRVLDLGCG
jgi:hypothetical protein